MDSSNFINLLPKDMIEEILARVAASSMRALFNAKRSCALFNEVGNSNYVYRYVSLDRITLNFSYMRPEECSFYQKCVESENPEAMYREGLKHTDDPAVDFWNKAVSSGHTNASYILGFYLIGSRNKCDKQRGMKILGNIKTSRGLRECRKNLSSTLNYSPFLKKRTISLKFLHCPLVDPQKKRPAWPLSPDEEDKMCCQKCRWNLELNYVYCILSSEYLDAPNRCESVREDD